MATENWKWAKLTSEQMRLLAEAEQTLGADYLLVYQPNKAADPIRLGSLNSELPIAPLNDSQLECLRGLETRLGAVVVAYQRSTD